MPSFPVLNSFPPFPLFSLTNPNIVSLFSFDVVADGIASKSPKKKVLVSKTTGDRDGFDLLLDNASSGKLIFESTAGKASVNLAELTDSKPRQAFDFGGVDMQLIVERYPAELSTLTLSLTQPITPPASKLTPYFVKATQVDGEMASASPIYFAKT